MKRLTDKTALVTGAGRGIGRAIALHLAEEGVRLALHDINRFELASTGRDARQLGAEATEYCGDISSSEEQDDLVRSLHDQWAGVDLLVNNAGVTYHGATHTMPLDEWERLIDINLRAPVRLTQSLLPALLARPEAHVLNVCSVLGLSGMPRVTAYCTTKFAMVGYSESLRAEYGRVGLGVTALCPGFVKTGLFGAARPEHDGHAPKAPPEWMCVSAERVARRAIKAVRRNDARVVLDPTGRPLHGAKRLFPTVFDALLSIGRGRRMAKKARELDVISPDRTEALRVRLGLDVCDHDTPIETVDALRAA